MSNKTSITDCIYICGDRYDDNRGHFQEIFSTRHKNDYNKHWKQCNTSWSLNGVIRGMHCAPYAKLVSCLRGKIFDVVVDLRPESKTFKEWMSFELSDDTNAQVFIPAGYAHGFYCYKNSLVMYLQDDTYASGKEDGWHYDSFGIEWPKPTSAHPYIISERDANAPAYK